jgi:hypothetical protein
MKLEKAIVRQSHIYFIVFLLLALAAFWYTYVVRIKEQESYRMHLHGATLLLCCLMLIVQPYLIRTGRKVLHRRIGWSSYLLVPVLIFTTIDLLRYRLPAAAKLATMDYFAVALVVNSLVAFVIFYGLAIYYRGQPMIHARYMICTAFPMFTPITDRIQYSFFPSTMQYMPQIDGNPILPGIGFILADLILLGLSIWDWRSHRRWNVFPFALAVLVAYHISVFTFYKFSFWQHFCVWLKGS